MILASVVAAATTQVSEGCGKDGPKSGSHTIAIKDPLIGNIERTYRLYVPDNYNKFLGTPLVLDFHGYYDTGSNQEEQSGIKTIADKYNFIAVWPDGLDDTVVPGQQAYSWNSVGTVESPGPNGDTCKWNALNQWNGYACHSSCRKIRGCRNDKRASGCDCSTCADDVRFVDALLDKLEGELCIARNRVFASGMSNGGMMVYDLVQSDIAVRFTAVAPVASSPLLGFGTSPRVPVAMLEIHGSRDEIIPANVSGSYNGEVGPEGSTVSSDGYYYEPVERSMERFASINKCGSPRDVRHYPTPYDGDTALYCVEPHGTCDGPMLVRCTHGLGHTWPFIGRNGPTHFATLIWEFFTNAADVLERRSSVVQDTPILAAAVA